MNKTAHLYCNPPSVLAILLLKFFYQLTRSSSYLNIRNFHRGLPKKASVPLSIRSCHRRCSIQKLFLKISQNSKENTRGFRKTFKNCFFTEHIPEHIRATSPEGFLWFSEWFSKNYLFTFRRLRRGQYYTKRLQKPSKEMHNKTTLMLKLFQKKETNHSIENVGKDSIYFPKCSFAFSLIENYKMLGSFWELSRIFNCYSKLIFCHKRKIHRRCSTGF